MKERFEHLRNGIIKVLASVEALIDFGEGEEIEHGVWDQGNVYSSYAILLLNPQSPPISST